MEKIAIIVIFIVSCLYFPYWHNKLIFLAILFSETKTHFIVIFIGEIMWGDCVFYLFLFFFIFLFSVCILNIFSTMIEDYVKESLALFCNRKVYFFLKRNNTHFLCLSKKSCWFCCYIAKSCLTLQPRNPSLLVSSVHGIFWARILKQVAISFSAGSSQPRDQTCVSCIGRQILYHWATREPIKKSTG